MVHSKLNDTFNTQWYIISVIEESGGNLSLVRNTIAQQIILKKGIVIKT